MTEHRTTLDNFRRAGRGHLHSACRVLERTAAGTSPQPALTPCSAAYLAHVSLECAIKARLLSRGGYVSVEALAEKAPQVHAELFRGARGHDLNVLGSHLRIKGFVETCGKPWSDDACWKRMTASGRPYSLRYGTEPLATLAAEEEVQRASVLGELLLDGITVGRLRKPRRGAR